MLLFKVTVTIYVASAINTVVVVAVAVTVDGAASGGYWCLCLSQ